MADTKGPITRDELLGNADRTENNSEPSVITLNPPKRRGRPPGGKNSVGPSVSLPSATKAPSRPSSAPSDYELEQAKFLGLGVVSIVELVESMVHGNCTRKIEKKRPERLDEFKEMAAKLALQEKDKELIATSAAKIAERHEWMTKFAPEVLLCVTLGQYSVRQIALVRFVDNVTKEKNQGEVITPETK